MEASSEADRTKDTEANPPETPKQVLLRSLNMLFVRSVNLVEKDRKANQ
jgi:hypothetical protein